MQRCKSLAPAHWLVDGSTSWQRLVTFGPVGFAAYGRVRFIPDPLFLGQQENSVERDGDQPSDPEVARRTLAHLRRSTTSDSCWVCVDVGAGRGIREIGGGPLVRVPNRDYAMFSGALDEVIDWTERLAVWPALVWPADRSWCFASDVDPHWAGVGGSRDAADALLAAPDLDAVRWDPEVKPPAYR